MHSVYHKHALIQILDFQLRAKVERKRPEMKLKKEKREEEKCTVELLR